MAIVYKAYAIEGLSTDSKPTLVPTGRKFYETDTERWYDFNGSTWAVGTGIAITHSETIGDYSTPSADVEVSSGGTITSEPTASFDQTSYFYEMTLYSGFATYARQVIKNTNSILYDQFVTKLTLRLKRQGSPTGTATIGVWNSSDVLQFTFGTQDVSTLSTGGADYTFENLTGYTLQNGDRIGLSYSGGNGSNYVTVFRSLNEEIDSDDSDAFLDAADQGTDLRFALFRGLQTTTTLDDDNTGTAWTSSSEANPNAWIDCGGSATNLFGLAIHLDSATTETEIKIQSSSDASTWTDLRTITVSNMTNNAWNYIRFNLVNARYLRVYGSSGSSTILSLDEIKYLTRTDAVLIREHQHFNIDSSSTDLPLSG